LTVRPKIVFTLLLLVLVGSGFLPVNSPRQAYALPLCAPAPSGLVAWWPGDDNPYEFVNKENGVLQGGATYAAGKVGDAFRFDGSTGYVQVANRPLWNFGANDFTIDLWARFSTVTGTDPFIAHDEGGGNLNKWIFWHDSTGLTFHINSPTLGPLNVVTFAWSPSTLTWYHLAVTRSGNTYVLYIDGVQKSTATDSHAIPDADAALTIGRAESFYFNGKIDEVEIANRALSSSEISNIYNAGSAGKCVPVTWQTSYMEGTSSVLLTIDGSNTYTYAQLPHTWYWRPGTTHTVTASTPVSGAPGTRYVFSGWVNGGGLSGASGTYYIGDLGTHASGVTVTATYTTLYRVNAKTNHGVALNVNVVVDSNYASPKTTPFFMPAGRHTFAASWTILVGGVSYNFLGWRDATGAVLSRGATFTYDLEGTLTAVYGLPTYTLTVFVYDSTTRAPLMNANVRLDGVLVGSTDSLGRLVISGVEAGTHTVRVAKGTAYSPYTTTVNVNSNLLLRVFLNRV